jgi:AcrR family transcriptional regulator
MPKLWSETIDSHRRTVRDTTLDTAAALVAEHGLASVTMSQIAASAGIGRATLYKYFPNVESILTAWHERRVGNHLQQLAAIRDGAGNAGERLKTVLETYAFIAHEHHNIELASLMHQGGHVVIAREKLVTLIADLLRQGVKLRQIRDDVAPNELAGYCLYALSAAGNLPTKAAVVRLVTITMAGLKSD